MIDAISIVLRLLLYGELTLLFGGSFFIWYALNPSERSSGQYIAWRRPLGWLSVLALITSAAALVAVTAQMTGSIASALDPQYLLMVAKTSYGQALAVRLGALTLAIFLLALHPWRRLMLIALVAVSATALGSLAWGGHAMSFEGSKGALHLAADIAHLLAAGAWLGAIAALLALVWSCARFSSIAHRHVAVRALASFSTIGTVLVATILMTGLVNSWALIGVQNIALAPTTLYGQLLLAKLALFIGMLGLAAANRYYFTPRLEGASHDGAAVRIRLRHSLLIELSLALAILALVAFLGTLAPPEAA